MSNGNAEFHFKSKTDLLEWFRNEIPESYSEYLAVKEVMKTLVKFIQQHHLVAHNASFDSKFLDAEFSRINHVRRNEFACSMLSSRRIYQDAPNHKLETLVRYKMLKTDGTHHRALADAEMTAHLWIRLISDIKSEYGLKQVSFQLMQQLGRISKKKVGEFMRKSGLE